MEKLERLECPSPAPAKYVAYGLVLGQPDGAGNYVAGTVVATVSGGDAGHLTGSAAFNFGSYAKTSTIDASLVVNPDCTVTRSGAGSGRSHFYGVAVMKHGRVTLHMVEVDPPPTAPSTGANLPGTTVEFTAVGTP